MPSPLQVLSAGRIVAGALAWVAPSQSGRLAGIGGPAEAHLAARLFGARDVALGAATLAARGPTGSTLVKVGLACDVLDVGAVVIGSRQGSLPKRTAGVAAAAALAAVTIGALHLRNDES